MAFCSDCGAKVEAGARFCENCGSVLNTNAAAHSPSFKVSDKHIKIAIASVLVLVFAVALFSVLGKSNVTVLASSSPESVAKAFVEGAVKGDRSIGKLCAGDDVDRSYNMGIIALGLSMTKDRKFTYKTTRKTSSEAVVQVYGPSEHFCVIELEYNKGKWLVSFVN